MDDIVLVLVGAVFGNDLVLRTRRARLPFVAETDAARVVAGCTGIVAIAGVALAWALERGVLAPLDLVDLRVSTSLLSVAVVSAATFATLVRVAPALRSAVPVLAPLVAADAVAIGAMPGMLRDAPTLAAAVSVAATASIAFAAGLPLFRALQERVEIADVPAAWRGTPIALVTAGLLSLALTGVAGLVPGG